MTEKRTALDLVEGQVRSIRKHIFMTNVYFRFAVSLKHHIRGNFTAMPLISRANSII